MATGDQWYITTASSNSTAWSNGNYNTYQGWYTFDTTDYYQKQWQTQQPPKLTITYPAQEDPHMEKCHLCQAELDSIDSFEWRENVAKKNKDPEYVWKKKTVKFFACGTIKREGDVHADEKRVSLGEDCIEISNAD